MSSLRETIMLLRQLDQTVPLEDLFSKGGCRIQADSEKQMKSKERRFKDLGFETRTHIDRGSGSHSVCMPNEYYVYVSLN